MFLTHDIRIFITTRWNYEYYNSAFILKRKKGQFYEICIRIQGTSKWKVLKDGSLLRGRNENNNENNLKYTLLVLKEKKVYDGKAKLV